MLFQSYQYLDLTNVSVANFEWMQNFKTSALRADQQPLTQVRGPRAHQNAVTQGTTRRHSLTHSLTHIDVIALRSD